MVREARFSWDDADGREPPLRHDSGDPFDDELFDPLVPPPSDHSSAGVPRSPKKRRRQEPESERRHLAGADWINERPLADNRPSE
jgi:hypothetical protein